MQRTRIFLAGLFCLLALLVWVGGALVLAQGPDGDGPRPTPTSVPDAPVQSEGATQEGTPDLIVKEIDVSPATLYVEQNVTIRVVIANVGTGDVPEGNNFWVDLYVDPPSPPQPGIVGDPTHTWGVQAFSVPAGGEHTLEFTTVYTDTGQHQVYAAVDQSGNVLESNEENNVTGPTLFDVRTRRFWRQSTHEDFQKGFSNLDLSHPRGLIQIGLQFDRYIRTGGEEIGYVTQQFQQPELDASDPTDSIYYPDTRVYPSGTVTDSARQIKPHLVRGATPENLGIIWEDWTENGLDSDVMFARSDDGGDTWFDPVLVNSSAVSAASSQLDPVVVYSEACDGGVYYAFWADNRAVVGDSRAYNIWYAYSNNGGASWTEPAAAARQNPINTFQSDLLAAQQTKPTAAVAGDGSVYVAWQDRRNGNNDIYFAYSEMIDCNNGGAVTWSDNVRVTDDALSTDAQKDQNAPALSVLGDTVTDTRVYLGWQDTSEDAGDVYVARGKFTLPTPQNFSFDIDSKFNTDGVGVLQKDPSVDAVNITQVVSYTIPAENEGDEDIECAAHWNADAIHSAWQDFRNDDADVYYGWMYTEFTLANITGQDPQECNDPEFYEPTQPSINAFEPQQNFNVVPLVAEELSGDDIDATRSCWGPNSDQIRAFTDEWQGEPIVKVFSEFSIEVMWSDGRSADALNYDIHTLSAARRDESSLNYLDFVGVGMLNDNAKRMHLLIDDETSAYSSFYAEYMPAGASQRRPTFLTTPYVVAWDDNRWEDPFAGRANNRDVFFAQLGNEPRGTYISPVFDAGSEATWYDITWWGPTQTNGELFFQVRLGNTPTPPLDDKSTDDWTPWSGVGGAGGIYDASGQNVRDADGSFFPEYRYVQYRLRINPDKTNQVPDPPPQPPREYFNGACVSEVQLNYEAGTGGVFLPIVTKGSGSGGGGSTSAPNDEHYGSVQWHLRHINSETAWAQSKGSGVTIAVLDTGVDMQHPDLQSKLLPGYDFINDDNDPDDNDGDYGDPSVTGFWGHGTHVAGTAAAATNNGIGMAGVGWSSSILPVKVLDENGQGTALDVALGIDYAVQQGADVINMSLGGTSNSSTLADAVQNAVDQGALLVAAAGNERQDGSPTTYPGAYAGVTAVAAVGDDNSVAWYSNRGSYVDVAAPGGAPDQSDPGGDFTVEHWVWSTYPTDKGSGIPEVGYARLFGTSMATPHVSGLAALIWSKNPGLSSAQVAGLIESTATDLGPAGRDDDFGHGLINAGSAVEQAGTLVAGTSASEDRRIVLNTEPAPLNAATDFEPGRLLVGMEPSVDVQSFESTFAAYDVDLEKRVLGEIWLARVPEGQELAALDALQDLPGVRFVEPNYYYYAQ